jgi:Na+(H+)/acetate symporter ActP
MLKLLKTNSVWYGIAIGLLVPVILYFSLSFIVEKLSLELTFGIQLVQEKNIELVSIFLNLFIMYPYLQKPDYERTGRGVLLVTFIMALLHFFFRYKYLLFN